MPTFAPRTRIDLVNEALMNLGVLAAGQDPSNEDFDAVNGKVEALVSWLETSTIFDIDTIDTIPPELFAPLAVLLADDSAFEFGLPGVPAKPGTQNPRAAAIAQIIEVLYGRPTYEPLKISYF